MTKDEGAEIQIDHSAISGTNQRHGKRYRKVAKVRARQAIRETAVNTVLADGTKETSNVAEPGDIIVTGVGGERWVVKPETFQARYVLKRSGKAIYIARGQIVALQNPFGRPICMMAPWGEMQYGSEDCMIADVLDPATQQLAGEPYLIGSEEFSQTYRLVQAEMKTSRKSTK